MKYRLGFGLIGLCLITSVCSAKTYPLPRGKTNIVGHVFATFVEPGDSLQKIADRNDVGYLELRRANPQIKNSRKIKPWSPVIIPAAFILPDTPREGIVINLPELRLYYYPKGKSEVMTYPVGVGRPEWVTPIMNTKVVIKDSDPIWRVPKSIKEYMASKGVELPEIVEPGPENPLGTHALRLDAWGYLIHGTNRPETVGKRSSSGCIRMMPKDIVELFEAVPLGTPVRIINQPYKTGWYKREFYLEAHKPFRDQPIAATDSDQVIQNVVLKHYKRSSRRLNWKNIQITADNHLGYPKFISR